MKTTAKKLVVLLGLVILFTNISAQTEKEKGEALKKWFDGSEIVIDGTVEDAIEMYFINANGAKDGYLCHKVKINRVIKGNVVPGYINVKTSFGHRTEPLLDAQYPEGYNGIFPKNRYLLKIKKTEFDKDCFVTENKGVYNTRDDSKIILGEEKALYQMIQNYCGVDMGLPKVEKKSPIITEIKKTKGNPFIDATLHERKSIKSTASSVTNCVELFISEYLCDHSHNKAVEIYNPTNSTINLSNYTLLLFPGSSTIPLSVPLHGTIASKGTYVVADPNANSQILAKSNQTDVNMVHVGKNAVVLEKHLTHIDKVGEIGVNPGNNGWSVPPSGSTVQHDLRRKFAIGKGDTVWSNAKNEWDIFSPDSISNLNKHSNVCAIDPNLTLKLVNPSVTGTSPKYFEFDINITSDVLTFFDNTLLKIQYDNNSFDSNIVANGNVTITPGFNFTTPDYVNAQTVAVDASPDTLQIRFGVDSTQTAPNRGPITSATSLLLHVKIKIKNCGYNSNVSFTDTLNTVSTSTYTTNQSDPPGSGLPYTNTIYLGTLNQTLCQLSITGISPASVIGGAYYPGIPINESQLTIDGVGFGASKGSVMMKNAVNKSVPFYVTLDSYDITSWSNTQIVVNVPSVLFFGGPYYGGYPGTGYIYVKPSGSVDSVSSSALGSSGIVQIPYVLKNAASTSANTKYRISFAYRNVIDSLGLADTAAYCFRFDAATVTGNSNTYCRPLLKQAIKDWACGLPIKYKIGKDTTITTTASDGISYITFRGTGADTLSNPNFIAETGISGKFCNTNFFSTEADISFRLNPLSKGLADWYYVIPSAVPTGSATGTTQGGYTDFFEAALHELGHASLLQHVNDSTDLMYFQLFQNVQRAYISSNDQSGGLDNVTYSKTLPFSNTCPYSPFAIPPGGSTGCSSLTSTGVEKIGDNAFEIITYPNPVSDFLNVTFIKKTFTNNTIKLVNVSGQVVYSKNIGKNEGAQEVIDMKRFAQGMYMLIVTDDSNTVFKKIIIE